ncbi:sensor histidine kinase [Rhodoferax sp.]|uniref:sensor histidine kinase n=1 Tax=Rhodoferax sp. TaxID=50421 RepID=UPI002ACD9086|nr:ATP-binding protein [Rhodoferax sp.]MDZ7919857.1 ATP-binding protein [Rhodoferax sp.]
MPLPTSLTRLSQRPGRSVWAIMWLLGLLTGGAGLLVQSMDRSQANFETDARIAHRILSQRALQHEAVLATLSLMQPALDSRLPAIYPQFLNMWRRMPGQAWPANAALATVLNAAEGQKGAPQLASTDFAAGRFWIAMAPASGAPDAAAYALEVSLPLMVPWADWPFGDGPESAAAKHTQVWLEHGNARWQIHAGDDTALRRFVFRKHLAATSQPFDMVAERSYGLADLPWGAWLAWLLGWSLALAALASALRQRRARQRAEELLRLGQVSRLNALGELAAGLAHELNQPLTAVLASTQATTRLLAEDPPDLEQARSAMGSTVVQARRAAEVVARLRRAIERPNTSTAVPLDLGQAASDVLQLLEPECHKRQVAVQLQAPAGLLALGDPVALEQILHNLVTNALHALEQVQGRPRSLLLQVEPAAAGRLRLVVQDNGPGVPPAVAERLFEPFVSARPGGLGLGLSLCETLAQAMGGHIRHEPAQPGTRFVLELPAAPAGASA